MKSRRTRILYICSRVPYSEFSGFNVRVRNVMRILRKHYDVDLICLSRGDVEEDALIDLKSEVHSLKIFKISARSVITGVTRAMFSRRPIQSGLYECPQLSEWIKENSNQYQLLICHLMRTAEFAQHFEGPKIVELNDSISRHYSRGQSAGSLMWRSIRRIEASTASSYEGELLRRFDTALMHTKADKQFTLDVHPHGEGVLKLSTFGIPPEFEADLPASTVKSPDDPYVIQFVGKMDYDPNVDAVNYFATTLFPKIRKRIPNSIFQIVGDRPNKTVRKLASGPGVVVTGRVDDLLAWVRKSDISVIPMRIGGGIQTKAIQAMSQNVPVVLSSAAARGIEGLDGKHFLVADGVNETFDAVVRIYEDKRFAADLGTAARRLILENYVWDVVENQYVEDIEQLVSSLR